jgi:hypothetical protein
VWRAFLARSPRPGSWINVTLKFAGALLKHPSEARNEEAVKLARTIIDGSSGAGVGEAKDIEKKGLQLLPAKKRKALETCEVGSRDAPPVRMGHSPSLQPRCRRFGAI